MKKKYIWKRWNELEALTSNTVQTLGKNPKKIQVMIISYKFKKTEQILCCYIEINALNHYLEYMEF